MHVVVELFEGVGPFKEEFVKKFDSLPIIQPRGNGTHAEKLSRPYPGKHNEHVPFIVFAQLPAKLVHISLDNSYPQSH